jgi:hypothetical protein
MNAELIFFGKRVDMAERQRRRVLVVAIYAAMAVFLAIAFSSHHWEGMSPYVIWTVILICRLFLGGYYPGGLIKPFNEKASKRKETSSLQLLRLRVFPSTLTADGEYENDERELNQRGQAHYLAYRVLGLSLLVPWAVSSFFGESRFSGTYAVIANHVCSAMLLTLLLLFLTLPQAILLWTEPDMDQNPEPAM